VRSSTFVICALVASLAGCGGGNDSPTSPTPAINVPFSSSDLQVGAGAEAVNGARLTVHYSGWLFSPAAPDNKGSLFDTSVGRTPFSFVLGAGSVIRGWDQGVGGMRVGGVRRLVIPPDLAYGAQGVPPVIPGNATLIFEISLLDVQ
jgi:FKBP-type peptidyl-prolyl cis-trans isomerase